MPNYYDPLMSSDTSSSDSTSSVNTDDILDELNSSEMASWSHTQTHSPSKQALTAEALAQLGQFNQSAQPGQTRQPWNPPSQPCGSPHTCYLCKEAVEATSRQQAPCCGATFHNTCMNFYLSWNFYHSQDQGKLQCPSCLIARSCFASDSDQTSAMDHRSSFYTVKEVHGLPCLVFFNK